jgi:hypothetical protein
MVQSKNVLSTFMHSFFALGLVSVQFALIGYSLAFGTSQHGVIGGLDYIGLSGIDETSMHGTVPHLAFVAYQCMFAVITPALISGAYAERMSSPCTRCSRSRGRRWSTIRSRTGCGGPAVAREARRDRLRGRHGRASIRQASRRSSSRSCSVNAAVIRRCAIRRTI